MKELFSKQDRQIIISCLCIALIIWVLNKLSKSYETEIPIEVSYINLLPMDKVLINEPEKKLFLWVEATGSSLLRNRSVFRQPFEIDFSRHSKSSELKTFDLINQFEEKLSNINVRNIKPKTIQFQFDDKKTKLLPILLNRQITIAKGFELEKNGLQLMPDSVKISGPASMIDSLKFWETEQLTHNNVAQNIEGKLKLKAPQELGFQVYKNIIDYKIKVEEYTEKELNLKIRTVNLPPSSKVFIFPQHVKINFQVSLNDFEQVDTSYFKVIADFENFDINNNKKIDLQIAEKPVTGIKDLHIRPKSIEYIIIE